CFCRFAWLSRARGERRFHRDPDARPEIFRCNAAVAYFARRSAVGHTPRPFRRLPLGMGSGRETAGSRRRCVCALGDLLGAVDVVLRAVEPDPTQPYSITPFREYAGR